MTPEKLVERLKGDLGERLRSVILYGSAAAGDYAGKRSDYNVLVVATHMGLAELDAMAGTARAWAKAGNPAPLLFTLERLRTSADVFPIELLDIKDTHGILYGEDVLDGIAVSRENLRLELEHELKGKLIQLRERYLLSGGKSRAVAELMVQSLSTFLVLFRAALRLYGASVPPRKLEALTILKEHVDFDAEVFTIVSELKEGSKKPKEINAAALFARYLQTIEAVVDAVDAAIHGDKS